MKPVPVSKMQTLRFLKNGEQLYSTGGAMAALLKLCHNFVLSRDMLLAERNMLFDLHQMLLQHCLIHLAIVNTIT